MLFSIIKRQKQSRSQQVEMYTPTGWYFLLYSTAFPEKRTQEYRKGILSSFFSFSLDRLASKYLGGAKVPSYSKKYVFIRHYFLEYLNEEKSKGLEDEATSNLMYDIFKWHDDTRMIDKKVRKRGLGNIWYLNNLLTKSPLMRSELSLFIKRDYEALVVARLKADIRKSVL